MSAEPSRTRADVQPEPVRAFGHVATLDALRGLAALVVVAMHGREVFWIGMKPYLQAYPYDFGPTSLIAYALSPLISGAIGVSVLFVLSGYVIHRAQLQRPHRREEITPDVPLKRLDVGAFYQRRLVRIYPALVLALVVTAGCDWVSRQFVAHPALGPVDAGTLLANLFSLQGLLAQPFGSNTPLWSLAIEVQFYCVYPLALMLRRQIGSDRMMATVAAFSLVFALILEPRGVIAFPQYFAAWWLGAYMAERDAAGRMLPAGWEWVAGACLLMGSVAYQAHYFYVGLMLWAVGAAPLVSAAVAGRFPVLASSRALSALGRFSYTLYAVHFPIVVMLSAVALAGVRQPNILVAIGLTGVAVVLSYGAYWLAEWPSVKALDGMREGKSWREVLHGWGR